MARGRGRGSTPVSRRDAGRGSGVPRLRDEEETPQETQDAVLVPEQHPHADDAHDMAVDDDHADGEQQGEDSDDGEVSPDHPVDQTLPVAHFDPMVENP